MLVSLKNLTAQAIPELGLTANQTKAIWMNKTFWHPNGTGDIRTVLYQKIQAQQVVMLDEFDLNLVYWSTTQNIIINQDKADDMAVFTGTVYGSDEDVTRAERIVSGDIFQIMATILRREKQSGNLPGYTAQDYANALETKNVCVLLNSGAAKQAGTAINSITTDAFFTVPRKAKLQAICAALDLG